MKFVATFTKTIPILILFLKQAKIIKYMSKVIPIEIAKPQASMIIPTKVKIAKIDKESMIIVYTIIFGAIFNKNMKIALQNIDPKMQPIISPLN
jgi:hypothetical protein